MASVDAAGSCGSHPGRFFGIGRLVVELLYAYYFVEQSYLVVNCGSLCLSMCSLDAARSSGWNPGICIATRDLLPDLSPLLGRVHQINLAHSTRLVPAVRTLVAVLEMDGWLST
jgi:hypothetical protein